MTDRADRLLAHMTQPEAARRLAEGTAIVVTGSIEQHGSHLPLGTDYLAALTIALRVAEALDAPVVPLSPVGVAPYHLPWPGSLSLRPETLMALLYDVCEGLARAGVERVLLINWHEGNTPAVRVGIDRVQRDLPLRVIVAETHIVTNSLYPEEMEFTHAGAMETAAVLAHDPTLVRLDQRRPGDPVEAGNAGHALFRRRDVFPVMRDFREVAAQGWYGSPETITLERAEQIIDEVAGYVVDRYEQVCSALAGAEPGGPVEIPQETH